MLIILSPAKTLNIAPLTSPLYTEPTFLAEAEKLNKKLKGFSREQLGKEMKLSPSLAELNYERNQVWGLPFTPENAKPAIHTFQGDVYQGLKAEDFTKEELEFAQNHLRILSGLYGVLRPMDLIQPYRLEMGTALKIGKHKNLYQFWGHKITETLNTDLENQKDSDGILLNLASHEYFKSIVPEKLQIPVITPDFKEDKGKGYQTFGLLVKRARGLMARYLVKNQISSVEEIKSFNLEGYQFNPQLSSESQWVFTRNS